MRAVSRLVRSLPALCTAAALGLPLVTGAQDPFARLDDAADPARGRLLATLARQSGAALSAEERGARCRLVPTLRRTATHAARGNHPVHALVEVGARLEGCRDGRTGEKPVRVFEVREGARGAFVGRPLAEGDARRGEARYPDAVRMVAACAAYESDASLSPHALRFVRSDRAGFGACAARGLDEARIRREVAECLDTRRTGDALVTFTAEGGDEACRVVVRTERAGTSVLTRVSASSAGSDYSHAFAVDGAAACEVFGGVDDAGCARRAPLRRATSAACPLAPEAARALAAAPGLVCAGREELDAMRVTHRSPAPTAGFTLAPTLGVLARGRSAVPDAEVNAFVAEASRRATSCPSRGEAPAGRRTSSMLLTFSVGPEGVGAITTAATNFDQGLAGCLSEAVRATQSSLRLATPTDAPPIYQYTVTVAR